VRAFDPRRFDPARIRRHAEQFDVQVFKRRISDFVADRWEHWQNRNPRRPRALTLPHPVPAALDALDTQPAQVQN
jgi:hypothetical protein